MTKHDLSILSNFLHGLYRDKFPGLTEGMAQLWYEDLKDLDADLVTRGAKRWARHHTLKAPSLDELRESVELVQEQGLKARLPQPATNPIEVLKKLAQDAAAASPEFTTADTIFGKCMIKLLECRTRQEGRYSLADCAGQLMTWAAYYRPKSRELAEWLDHQATIYERMAMEEKDRAPLASTQTSMPRLGETRSMSTDPCLHTDLDVSGACTTCGTVLEYVTADAGEEDDS